MRDLVNVSAVMMQVDVICVDNSLISAARSIFGLYELQTQYVGGLRDALQS